MTGRLVVVGGGQAAFALVAKLRALKDDRPITIIAAEASHPYQRPPLSKKYLLGEADLSRLMFRPETWYPENNVDIRLSTEVTAIDRDGKTVTLSDGSTLHYQFLALATGATPRRLPAEIGGDLDGVFTVRDYREADGSTRYCYLLPDGSESPTLRLHPGDELILHLKNELSSADVASEGAAHAAHLHTKASDPCSSGAMTPVSTNLHFHGLTVPPVCHQDDVLRTSIQPTDPPFEYRMRIPANEPPGLYWYHPHIHGFSSRQASGGRFSFSDCGCPWEGTGSVKTTPWFPRLPPP